VINADVTDHCQKVKHGCGLELCTVAICAWKLSEIQFAFFFFRKCRRAYWTKTANYIDCTRENCECYQCWFIWL